MTITEINCFALRNDGTLLMKTEVANPRDDYRYCFYIYRDQELMFKSPYDTRSFFIYKVDRLGTYQIKGFVRNGEGTQKQSLAIKYTLTKSNAEKLSQEDCFVSEAVLSVAKSDDLSYIFSVSGHFPADAQYAWYIYREGEKKPEFRGAYSNNPTMMHNFNSSGFYMAKLFVRIGEKKLILRSDTIMV